MNDSNGVIGSCRLRGGRATFLAAIILAVLLLCSCGMGGQKTVLVEDSHDWAGNLLKDCETEITDHGSYASIVTKYHGKTVSGIWLNEGYEAWDSDGRPESGIDYAYYYVYDSTGERHALYYMKRDKACWEISLHNRSGEHFGGHAYFSTSGEFIPTNIVTGDTTSAEEDEELKSDAEYYYNQATDLLGSLDPDYLAKIDPSTSVLHDNPREEGDSSATVAPEGSMGWDEASSHVGEQVSVYGPVVAMDYAESSSGSPTFIDLGAEYPDKSRVSIVIWGEYRSSFAPSPEELYQGKTICVTGEIYEYEGVCCIEASSPAQIQIL